MAAVKSRHSGVTIHREPINSDSAAEVPRDQWPELLAARREFCERKLPHDCRLLLFFIQDGAASEWLGLGGREQYIRDGLKLEPQMVEWALDGLKATRPDVAVEFEDAVKLGQAKHAGPGRGKKTASNTSGLSLGKRCNAAYIRARLERDGHTELLAKVERGEASANAAAIGLGWRTRRIQVAPTVQGFASSAQAHLSPEQRLELKELL